MGPIWKSGTLRVALVVLAALCALTFTTCGGKKTRLVAQIASTGSGGLQAADDAHRVAPPIQAATEVSLDEALAELDALETPNGVNDALFAELKEALRDALGERASSVGRDLRVPPSSGSSLTADDGRLMTAKLASTPPTGEANRVNDLALTDNGDGTFTLSWHYKNLGDYDQNGIVGISDITPLARHFGEEVPADDLNRNSIQAVIDGSGNGVVDIADIVVLAQRLATQVAGYSVEGAQAIDGAFSFIQAIGLEPAATDGRLQITHTVSQVGFKCVRVSPTDASGAAGEPSNAVFMPATGRGDWYMFGRDAQHSHTSPYTGPRRNPVVKWKLDIGMAASALFESYPCPAIAGDGTLYVIDADGNLLAVNPDGTIKWQCSNGAYEGSNPAIGISGAVYVGCHEGRISAVSPEGAVLWEYTLDAYGVAAATRSSPLVSPDGRIYVGTCVGGWGACLFALNPDGSLCWRQQGPGCYEWNAPASSPDGTVYAEGNNTMYAVDPSGAIQWQLEIPQIYAGPSVDSAGNICLKTAYNDVEYYDPAGELLWRYALGRILRTRSIPVVGVDGTVYIGNSDTYFYALDPDGTVKWRFEASYRIESTAVIDSESRIFFGCDGGFLYCLNREGNLIWRLDVGDSIQSALAMAADGTLYFVAYDGFLYAVAEDPSGEPPEAVMSVSPMWGPAPLEVSFDSSFSNDPDGEIVLCDWDFNGDGQFEQSTKAVYEVSYTFAEGGHIRINILTSRLSGWPARLLEIVVALAALLMCAFFLYHAVLMVYDSFNYDMRADSISETPVFIPQIMIVLGFALLTLQVAAHVVRRLLSSPTP